jgi:WD40 repeat protein
MFCLLSISTSLSGNAFADEKAWLGVEVQPVPGATQLRRRVVVDELGSGEGGVLVSAVTKGSPAEQMGVQQNDVILSFNNKRIKNPPEYNDAVSAASPGDKVVLLIYRSRTQLTLEGTMGRPPVPAETSQSPKPSREAGPASTSTSAKIFAPTGQEAIRSVAISPDGKTSVSGGKNALKLWDIATGREIRTFKGDADATYASFAADYSVAFSPDGRYVLSGSVYHHAKIWDVSTGKEMRTFYGPTDGNGIVAFSPDGKYALFTGSKDHYLGLWDVESGNGIAALRRYTDRVHTVTFSPDSRYALSASGTVIKLWDIAKGSEIRTFDRQKWWISSVVFSPDSKYALSGSGHTLKLWDIATGREIRTFSDGKGPMISAAFSPDGQQALSGLQDGTIVLWDVATGKEMRTVTGHTGRVNSIMASRDGRSFISGGADGTIRRWDVRTGNEIAQFISLKDNEWIALTPEGYYNSSLNAHKYLNIRMDDKVYGIDQFYDVFYRPDIVAAKLRGDDISNLITLTLDEALRNPPPTVEFTAVPPATDQPKVTVCYQVKSTGGGIGEVRLFHNGKLIASDGFYRDIAKLTAAKTQLAALTSKAIYEDMRGVIIQGKADATPVVSGSKGELVKDCKEVESVSGENEVSVVAFNSPNTVQSSMKTSTFNANIKEEEPHLYILSIGIDQYKDIGVNLKFAVKDSRDIEQRLMKQAATIYKPLNIHHAMLADKAATKTAITARINELSQKIRPTDSFVLFVAGHGVLLQSQYYMLTSEFDGKVNDNNLISSNEIVEMSKKVRSLSQLFIFDTCHAGGVDSIVSGLYDARMSVLAKKMGLHIYASASSKEAAMDGYQGNGLFTYTLLDGLNNNKGADKNSDHKVSLVELGEYSRTSTAEISKKTGHAQTPLIINFGKDNGVYHLR